MFDILPALLWIVAAVISLNICSITAIRGNIFSKTKSDVYPVRWSIVGLHFTSLIIGALPYPIYTMFKPSFSLKFQHFYEQVGWPSAALMVMLIATELVFMYLQARNGMKSEMEAKPLRTSQKTSIEAKTQPCGKTSSEARTHHPSCRWVMSSKVPKGTCWHNPPMLCTEKSVSRKLL